MEKKTTSNTPKRRILTSAKSERSSYFKAIIMEVKGNEIPELIEIINKSISTSNI